MATFEIDVARKDAAGGLTGETATVTVEAEDAGAACRTLDVTEFALEVRELAAPAPVADPPPDSPAAPPPWPPPPPQVA
jgi:hypothetical protein